MRLKLSENDRTNRVILFIILIALITTSVIVISVVANYFISLEETGGG